MSFVDVNCCLKLNSLLCGSKEYSSKKNKNNFQKNSIDNEIVSSSSTRIFSKENCLNIKSEDDKVEDQKNLQNLFNSKKKSFDYSCSEKCSIIHRSSNSRLNNQIIVKNVILMRYNLNDRLGLTLCYGLRSNYRIKIYIEEVDENSIAYSQGKLQRGDEIIKINNHRITTRDRAIQLIQQNSIITFQIIPFQFLKLNLSSIESTITEDDSGVILGWNNDFERIDQNNSNVKSWVYYPSNIHLNSRENVLSLKECRRRRCLSLNDLSNLSFYSEEQIAKCQYSLEDLISSQSLFQISTDNEKGIVKPLPFEKYSNNSLVLNPYQLNKQILSHLKEKSDQYFISTDHQNKRDKYSKRKRRKNFFSKSKQIRNESLEKSSIDSIKEDFSLLNRIFLRENEKELFEKPYLAIKYQQQSNIEKDKLKLFIQNYPRNSHFRSRSTTNISIDTNSYHLSNIFI